MTDDSIFRLVAIAGVAAVLPFALWFRIRSQRTGERLDRTQEGLFIMIFLRLFGLATVAGTVAWMVDPGFLEWARVGLPRWLRWFGAPIGAAAGALLVWTMGTLGPNLTDTVVTRRDHRLVTGGPYRWVRHPFYLAFLLAVLANALLTANWLLATTGGLAFALVAARTPIEERKLLDRFGERYARYMARTHRFLPRPPR